MIQGCFRHFRGIGPRTAALLVDKGFASWEDCISRENGIPINGQRRKRFIDEIKASFSALEQNDISYFISRFPTSEHWRILEHYFKIATFVDVETTGLSWHYNHASVIAAYHKGETHSFTYGENLDDFLTLAEDAELLVTFNGNCFDIPFLEKTFNIPSLGCPHLDLRWVAYHCGFRGGLKSIERELGIRRPLAIEGIDGFEAVDLFYRWQGGDVTSRDRLVSYCKGDVISTCLVAERLLARSSCDIVLTEPAELFKKIDHY